MSYLEMLRDVLIELQAEGVMVIDPERHRTLDAEAIARICCEGGTMKVSVISSRDQALIRKMLQYCRMLERGFQSPPATATSCHRCWIALRGMSADWMDDVYAELAALHIVSSEALAHGGDWSEEAPGGGLERLKHLLSHPATENWSDAR